MQDRCRGAGSGRYMRHYICVTCGTPWKYEHDRNNPGIGWSLRQQAEAI